MPKLIFTRFTTLSMSFMVSVTRLSSLCPFPSTIKTSTKQPHIGPIMPKYTTLNLSQILINFLADLLYDSILIMFIVLAPTALLSDFLKFVKPTCTCAIYRPTYGLTCYLPLVVCCTMHHRLSLRISMPHIGSQHLYFIRTLYLSMMQIHIQGTT